MIEGNRKTCPRAAEQVTARMHATIFCLGGETPILNPPDKQVEALKKIGQKLSSDVLERMLILDMHYVSSTRMEMDDVLISQAQKIITTKKGGE